MRRTGLPALGNVPWGTHLSLFYETKDDLLAALIPFFRAGLESNEHVLWVLSKNQPLTREEVWSALQRAVPDFERYAAAGSIDILSHDDWFLPHGVFDPEQTAAILGERLARAEARGGPDCG